MTRHQPANLKFVYLRDPRLQILDQARSDGPWDIIVIGGGASGLATAWDAVSRGYRCALIEKNDFAAATSSRSTKLIHGGVRYLQNGELSLVREALRERSLLLKNAPEFCHPLRFILPTHQPLARYYYRIGMWLYDLMAGDKNTAPAKLLSKSELLRALPAYHCPTPTGGIAYTDAQFDDTALAIAMAQCIHASSNPVLNYTSAERLITENGKVTGIIAKDEETGEQWPMHAKVVINATGIFSNELRNANDSPIHWSIRTSRGAHIVFPGHLLGSNHALIIPKTVDNRILFAIPWKGHTLIGTTDTPTENPELDPQASKEDIGFLIEEAQRAFSLDPQQISSHWAGLRPLVCRNSSKTTAKLSRKHIIEIAPNGLISLLGGKWTTCRSMAEDTIDAAIRSGSLPPFPCRSHSLRLTDHGALPPFPEIHSNTTQAQLADLCQTAYTAAFARTTDDILSRRSRIRMLDRARSDELQPLVDQALQSFGLHSQDD